MVCFTNSICTSFGWLVVSTFLKNSIVSWEGFSHILWKMISPCSSHHQAVVPNYSRTRARCFLDHSIWPVGYSTTVTAETHSKRLGSGRQGVATVPGGDFTMTIGTSPAMGLTRGELFGDEARCGQRLHRLHNELGRFTMLFMGQSTISTGPLSIAMLVITLG